MATLISGEMIKCQRTLKEKCVLNLDEGWLCLYKDIENENNDKMVMKDKLRILVETEQCHGLHELN